MADEKDPVEQDAAPVKEGAAPVQELSAGAIEGEQLIAELIGSARARGSLYRLICVLFAGKPEGPFVEGLAQTINADAPIENELMAAGFKDLATYLEPQRTNATLLDLIVDYSLSVEKIDLGTNNALGAPKDQLGATCESLSTLCNRQADLLEAADFEGALKMLEIQNSLYSERAVGLIGSFCDAVDELAVTLFFKGASKLARGFCQEERMFIDDSIAAVREIIDAKAGE